MRAPSKETRLSLSAALDRSDQIRLLFSISSQIVKKPEVKTKFKKLITNRWSGYMSGSSEAAKKLSPKRTALNLCKITLSRWKRNWVSRAPPDRCEILWPSCLIKEIAEAFCGPWDSNAIAAEIYECQLAASMEYLPLFWWRPTQRLHPLFWRSPVCRNPPQCRLLWHPT